MCFGMRSAGAIQYRHQYLDMSSQVVEASNWTRAGRPCPAAMGFSFAAGTTDGVRQSMWYISRHKSAEHFKHHATLGCCSKHIDDVQMEGVTHNFLIRSGT
jgi:Neutral/alkaline non-lysosomal ceramidase, N-terminal